MKCTIKNIKHYPGISYCKQGIKKEQFSNFAKKNNIVGGSNGSYRVAEPGKTYVYVSGENGNTYPVDIFPSLKSMTNGRKFTNKFINDLNSKIENVEFEVKEGESLKDCLNETIKKYI